MAIFRAIRVCIFAATLLCTTSARASGPGCPEIEGLIDFNCDGKIKLTFIGDSIVTGVGDSKRPIEGYVGRLQSIWPWAEIHNLGTPGITTARLLRSVKQALTRSQPPTTATALRNSDIIVIAVGVNDFYNPSTPGATVGNIVQLANYLRSRLKSSDGVAPMVIAATLLNCKRPYQQPFIRATNQTLLKYNSPNTLPVLIRFDKIDVFKRDYLRVDKLHPNGSGYSAMQRTAQRAIQGPIQTLMASKRTDLDADGLYDQVEDKFGANPAMADTDGDTLLDGAEVFEYLTDPSNRDTDDDGIDDNLDLPTPTPTPTPVG